MACHLDTHLLVREHLRMAVLDDVALPDSRARFLEMDCQPIRCSEQRDAGVSPTRQHLRVPPIDVESNGFDNELLNHRTGACANPVPSHIEAAHDSGQKILGGCTTRFLLGLGPRHPGAKASSNWIVANACVSLQASETR